MHKINTADIENLILNELENKKTERLPGLVGYMELAGIVDASGRGTHQDAWNVIFNLDAEEKVLATKLGVRWPLSEEEKVLITKMGARLPLSAEEKFLATKLGVRWLLSAKEKVFGTKISARLS